jgi:hypothetical protein
VFLSKIWKCFFQADNDDLKPCNRKIFEKGDVVFVTHSIPAKQIETWVRKIAKESKQKVDWHYFGGRAVIKALGDIDGVKETINKLIDEHDKLQSQAIEEIEKCCPSFATLRFSDAGFRRGQGPHMMKSLEESDGYNWKMCMSSMWETQFCRIR